MSLQEYLRTVLEAEASKMTMREVFARAESRGFIELDIEDVVAGIREDRESH